MALLGLSAVDPIGIAAMPVLLLQKRPLERSLVFLGGSLASLMIMGLLFARGLGQAVLRFENAHRWFVPGIETAARVILLGIAAVVWWRLRSGRASVEPSEGVARQLQLGTWHLFLLGAALVAVQSIIDVVFVIAMIRIGQLHLSSVALGLAVATYAVAALVLQLAVVVAYWLTPADRKRHTLDAVHKLLARYADRAVIGVSFGLGCGLIVIAALR